MDFRLGTWDARWQGGQGRTNVTAILGGSALEENFDGGLPPNGISGRSLSSYDRTIGRWRQFWADSHGGVLDLIGGPEGSSRFILETAESAAGQPIQSLVYEQITAVSFDCRWLRLEQGRWQQRWHILYRRIT